MKHLPNLNILMDAADGSPSWCFLQELINDPLKFESFARQYLGEVFKKWHFATPMLAVLSFYDPLSLCWRPHASHSLFINCDENDAGFGAPDDTVKALAARTFHEMQKECLTLNTFVEQELKAETQKELLQKTLAFRIDYSSRGVERYIYGEKACGLPHTVDYSPCKATTNDGDGSQFSWNEYLDVTSRFINQFLRGRSHRYGLVFPLLRGDESYGVFFLYTAERFSGEKLDELASDFGVLFEIRFHRFFRESRARYLDYARRTAAATIMSRNVSHNLGSHILQKSGGPEVRSKLQAVYTVTVDGITSPPPYSDVCGMVEDMRRELDRYSCKKWDYIAEISSTPLYAMTPARFFQQVMTNFLGNTLLIDSIASMEDLGYGWEWNITTVENQAPQCSIRFSISYEGKEYRSDFRTVSTDELRSYDNVFVPYGWRDIRTLGHRLIPAALRPGSPRETEILLPGPLGEFALYGILENIMRNAAKHNAPEIKRRFSDFEKGDRKEIVKISVDVSDEGGDYYVLRISEDLSKPEKEITAGLTLLEHLKKAVAEPIIDNDGRYRKKYWGLAEIMLCANLLGGKKKYEYDSEALSIENHRGLLTYRLRLMKPKNVAIVGENLYSHLSKEEREKFKAAGIQLFKSYSEKVAGFGFLVADVVSDAEGVPDRMLPFRRIFVDLKQGAKNKEPSGWLHIERNLLAAPSTSVDEFLVSLWCEWLRRWTTEEGKASPVPIELSLFLGGGEKEAIESWKRIAPPPEEAEQFAVTVYESVKECASLPQAKKSAQRILFDRHGMLLDTLPTDEVGVLGDHTSYVMFDKLSEDFSRIVCPVSSPLFPYKVMEAGLLRILIIDGRMAERAMKSVRDPDANKIAESLVGWPGFFPAYWHVAKAAHVFLTTHIRFDDEDAIPLHQSSYERARRALRLVPAEEMRCACPLLQVNCRKDGWTIQIDPAGGNDSPTEERSLKNFVDMVVIHQGDVDKFPEGWKRETRFINALRKYVPWVVVESGRGMPVEVQTNEARFLPFSVMDHWLTGERVAKFSMSTVLMNLTRRKDEDTHDE